MAWLRVDDRVRTHPKLVTVGPAAAWFWFCGVCYCREHLTDGVIPKAMISTLAPGVTNGKTLAEKLIKAELWHLHSDGFEVHDFLDWNPSRAEIQSARASDRTRKKKGIRLESDKIPSGIQPTPSRASAGDAGYGSLKGSGSSVLERGAGENPSRPPSIFGRRRLELANEGEPVPLRWDQFREIQTLAAPSFAGSIDDAYGPVLAWVHEVGAGLISTGTPAGAITNPWQFWREAAEKRWCVAASTSASSDTERIAAAIRASLKS